MSVSLRPLEAEDAQAVADLVGDYDAFHSDAPERPSARDVLDWWRRIDGPRIGAVDEHGGLVGAATFRRRGDYYLADVFVDPSARGRGVGTSLLEWAERETRDAGLRSLRTGTSTNDAGGKALLESRGFVYIRSF